MMRRSLSSSLVLLAVLLSAGGLAWWKQGSIRAAEAASAMQPEPAEAISVAIAAEHLHRPTTSAVGTVVALRSITVRNELAGTVRDVRLVSGQIVEAGALLVALDVAVEEAELRSLQARLALAETTLTRLQRLLDGRATSEATVDQAMAERDVARAQIARTEALIERKKIRAPFRARVGLADVHPGQYLDEGTELTTLQGVSDAAHVDFAVPQDVAAGLGRGERVEVVPAPSAGPVPAVIVAIDARVDATTRNAVVRARVAAASRVPPPGASVTVRVPSGAPRPTVVVPAPALRRGPEGDHVFVIARGGDGQARAVLRRVESGAMVGDRVIVHEGLAAGEEVATSGAFKLRDGLLVIAGGDPAPGASH